MSGYQKKSCAARTSCEPHAFAPEHGEMMSNQARIDALGGCGHVVEEGDTLWDLSNEHLGDARAWPDLYGHNADTVGADPDLIFPGQVLDVCGTDDPGLEGSVAAPPSVSHPSAAHASRDPGPASHSPIGSQKNPAGSKALGVMGHLSSQGLGQLGKGVSESELKALKGLGVAKSAGLGLLGHWLGDKRVAESEGGHLANSLAKGAGDGLASAAGIASHPMAQLLAAADGLVDTDNPAKMATFLAGELLPTSQATKGMNGGIDAATAGLNYLQGDHAAAYRGADVVRDNSMNSTYGSPTQVGTWVTAIAMGDDETANKAVDHKAKTGERGMALAWGNAATDLWDHDEGRTCVSDAEEKAWQEQAHWALPWTW